jgi:hypothetical protein
MGSRNFSVARRSWSEIARSREYQGRWVALDNVRYEAGSSQPAEAEVVDADEDLADLCARMREADHTNCAIVFCEDESFVAASVRHPEHAPRPRAAHH